MQTFAPTEIFIVPVVRSRETLGNHAILTPP